jgi:hypothetical protein
VTNLLPKEEKKNGVCFTINVKNYVVVCFLPMFSSIATNIDVDDLVVEFNESDRVLFDSTRNEKSVKSATKKNETAPRELTHFLFHYHHVMMKFVVSTSERGQ